MTTAQFKTEFERLLAAFPYFKPANPKAILDLWFEKLSKFETRDFHRAVNEVIDEAPDFFPAPGKIAKRCAELKTERRRSQIRIALNNCSVCFGTGWEFIEEAGMQRVKRCGCTAAITGTAARKKDGESHAD